MASDVSACSSTSSKKKDPIIYATLYLLNAMLSRRIKTSVEHLPKVTKKKEQDVSYIDGQQEEGEMKYLLL